MKEATELRANLPLPPAKNVYFPFLKSKKIFGYLPLLYFSRLVKEATAKCRLPAKDERPADFCRTAGVS